MENKIQFPQYITARSSNLVVGSVAVISAIHFIGFLALDLWLEFSGIGDQATKMELEYGRNAVVLLNMSAGLIFLLMAIFFHKSFRSNRFVTIGKVLGYIFIIRGVLGFFATIIGKLGTATPFWEIVFSTWALLTGIASILAYQELTR